MKKILVILWNLLEKTVKALLKLAILTTFSISFMNMLAFCHTETPAEQIIDDQIKILQDFGNNVEEFQPEEIFVVLSDPEKIPGLGFESVLVLRNQDDIVFNVIVPASVQLKKGKMVKIYRFTSKKSLNSLNELLVAMPK